MKLSLLWIFVYFDKFLFYCSFDYGDKFWLLKNRYFTCKCLSINCRYGQRISLLEKNEDEGEEDDDDVDNTDDENEVVEQKVSVANTQEVNSV